MKRKLTLAVMTTLLTIGMSSAAAYADTVTFTLTNPNQVDSTLGGTTLTFTVTATASASNGADVYLNGDSFDVSSPPLSLDDTDFFANSPFFLDPGTSATFDDFTVTVDPSATPGTYVGDFTFLGGSDGGAALNLGTVDFSVVVTPEPSSFLLLGSGLTGLVGLVRRKRMM
jgi:hypothetical protein